MTSPYFLPSIFSLSSISPPTLKNNNAGLPPQGGPPMMDMQYQGGREGAEICLLVIISTISRVFPPATHGVAPQDQDIMGTNFIMDEGEGEGWG